MLDLLDSLSKNTDSSNYILSSLLAFKIEAKLIKVFLEQCDLGTLCLPLNNIIEIITAKLTRTDHKC